jgi:hypothetical protein
VKVRIKTLIGAAAIAAALPMAAGAVTVTDGINFGTTNDLPGNYFSVVSFANGEAGDTLTWSFQNTSATAQAVTVASAAIEQLPNLAFFEGGTTTSLNGDVRVTGEGLPDGFLLNTIIAPGGVADLVFTYGDVFETPGNPGNNVVFSFNIASEATVIPLPASVFMLLAALGGLGVVGRRRKAAMG